MCGFAGELRFDQAAADVAAVARMGEQLAPRGPDAAGLVHQGAFAVAHRRLKIIDLSEQAQQPMVDRELGLTLVFNGCIYNHAELRQDLRALGYRFVSEGDTEVVLKAYHAWGERCVERFHGMFAFAVHERDSDRLVLARDRFGIKPLYLAEVPGGLRFASTLPALLAGGGIDTGIDTTALHHYLSWHAVVPAPRTLLRGVRKLPAAHLMRVARDGRSETSAWWTLQVAADPALAGQPAAEREQLVEAALRRAIDRRMVADVPVGVLLSGGVDSSLIVAMLAEQGAKDLQTFSIGFDGAGGEAGQVRVSVSDQGPGIPREQRAAKRRGGSQNQTAAIGEGFGHGGHSTDRWKLRSLCGIWLCFDSNPARLYYSASYVDSVAPQQD